MSCTIYIVRHGESVNNRDKIVSGHANPPLTAQGKQQAVTTKDRLSNIHFDEAYSSDLKRAIDTGTIIYGKSIPVEHQWRLLRERNFGSLDGQAGALLTKLREQNQPKIDTLSKDEQWKFKHAEDMESDYEVAERFISALHSIAEANNNKTVLVAAHGGTIRTTLIQLGYATQDELPHGSLENAGFAELIYESGDFKIGHVVGAIKRSNS